MEFSTWLETQERSPKEVFDDHLELRQGGHDGVEEDLRRNFADDIVVITNFGTFKGKSGVRRCAAILKKQLPCGKYNYKKRVVEGNVAFLEWTAECNGAKVEDGSDTFVIRNGKIATQTIHYTLSR